MFNKSTDELTCHEKIMSARSFSFSCCWDFFRVILSVMLIFSLPSLRFNVYKRNIVKAADSWTRSRRNKHRTFKFALRAECSETSRIQTLKHSHNTTKAKQWLDTRDVGGASVQRTFQMQLRAKIWIFFVCGVTSVRQCSFERWFLTDCSTDVRFIWTEIVYRSFGSWKNGRKFLKSV